QEAYQKFTLTKQSKAAKEAEFAGLAPSDKTVAGLRVFGLLVVFGVVYLFGAPHLYNLVDALRNQMLTPDAMAQSINNIKMYSSAIGGVLLLSAMAIYLYARKIPKSPRAVLSFSLFVFLCFDLFLFGRQYFLVSLYSADEIHASVSTPAAVKYIKSMPDYQISDRVQTLDDVRAPNLAMMWRVSNTAGYDPMSLKAYNQELASMEGWKNGEYHDDINLKQYDHPVLDELNVRYILTDSKAAVINDPVLKPLFTGPRLRAYERTSQNRSWASTAPRSENEDRKKMNDELLAVEQWAPASVNVESYQPQEISFDVEAPSPVWLRVSEWDYPHWRAHIRSGEDRWRPLHEFSSKEGFRVYAIDVGQWQVQVDYREPWGRWLLTALAWIVFAKLGAIAYLLYTGRFWAFAQRALGRYY
ncbi:hypothetical protein K8I31_02835, partial [bacterium]|nr:hypothetical protein [bacterium]